MAANQATLELRNNTDVNFRLWGEFISDGLLAGGWTLESTDINWATVTAPAQNTYAGYEIWKSPDEVGLTNFYLKLRYGSHNNATIGPALEWQVSWSYSGSGSSLGGTPTTAVSTISGSTAASATARLCTIAAGAGYVTISMGASVGTACAHVLNIERTLSPALEPQDELIICGHYWLAAAAVNQKVYASDSREFTVNSVSANQWLTINSSSTANHISRGQVGLIFMVPIRAYRVSPMSNYLAVLNNLLGNSGEQLTISIYGSNRTYILMTATGSGPGSFDFSASFQGLIRFD